MTDWRQMALGLRPRLRLRTTQGRPTLFGEHEITPVVRSLSLTMGHPGGPLALGWARHWPVAVLDSWHGQTRRVPIPDWTRRVTVALVVPGLLLLLAGGWMASKSEPHKEE
jgi:hypothetical protein